MQALLGVSCTFGAVTEHKILVCSPPLPLRLLEAILRINNVAVGPVCEERIH